MKRSFFVIALTLSKVRIHAYNLETVIVRCSEAKFLLSRLRSRQNMNILSRVCMNLKIHAYNLETDIVGYKGATIFVIALKI